MYSPKDLAWRDLPFRPEKRRASVRYAVFPMLLR
jgi:hypothetical protein